VGGTGQYIRSIIENWEIPAQVPHEELRQAIEHWSEEIGFDGLHLRLQRLDPEAAKLIDYRNKRRTVRALEVYLSSGRRFSEQRKNPNRHIDN